MATPFVGKTQNMNNQVNSFIQVVKKQIANNIR